MMGESTSCYFITQEKARDETTFINNANNY